MRVNSGYRLLPPDAHLMVPTSSPEAAKAGIALYTGCRRRSLLALQGLWKIVEHIGPVALPGVPVRWRPPLDPHVWTVLVKRWRDELGAFDEIAMHLRRPRSRAGASVLLLDGGRPVAFVKVRADGVHRMEAERTALDALGTTKSFTAPTLLTSGSEQDWHYLAMSAFAPVIHLPVTDPPLERIVSEYAASLPTRLPRPPGTPEHWQPMHGDLTPWNLRDVDHRLVLFDWEGTSWGPPQADLLWYDAVVSAVRLDIAPSGVHHTDEAADFWIQRLAEILRGGRSSLSAKIRRRLLRGWRP